MNTEVYKSVLLTDCSSVRTPFVYLGLDYTNSIGADWWAVPVHRCAIGRAGARLVSSAASASIAVALPANHRWVHALQACVHAPQNR